MRSGCGGSWEDWLWFTPNDTCALILPFSKLILSLWITLFVIPNLLKAPLNSTTFRWEHANGNKDTMWNKLTFYWKTSKYNPSLHWRVYYEGCERGKRCGGEWTSLTSIQETAHTFMNHPACEMLGWQFIAKSEFKPRPNSFKRVCVPLEPSCRGVVIHCFVTTENIFQFSQTLSSLVLLLDSLESSDLFCLPNSGVVPTENRATVSPWKLRENEAWRALSKWLKHSNKHSNNMDGWKGTAGLASDSKLIDDGTNPQKPQTSLLL